MIPIQIEVTKDDKNFRVIKFEVPELNIDELKEAMGNVELEDDEYIYQVCAPVKGCKLPQPCYDFFNGFSIYFSEES